MKNEMIGEVLRNFRRANNYSIKDVHKLLKERYIIAAEKTIYSWESGRSQPDADTLLILCDLYDIKDILGTFGYSERDDIIFTRSEAKVIKHYRKHPEFHHAIHVLLGM